MRPRGRVGQLSALVFACSLLYAVGLQHLMLPYAEAGIYFHPWSSEDMMQTVSIRELRHAPLEAFLYIHIQPPAFDALRAGLAQLWPSQSDEAVLTSVDRILYMIGAAILGLLVALVFRWLAEQCSLGVALLGSLFMLLHPASIFFATYLDSTLMSTFLILLAYYLLWRIKNGHPTSLALFSGVVVALFYTRSIFQWPAILLFATCLLLLGIRAGQLVRFFLVTGLLAGVYLAKQQYLFGLLSTSSLTGVNLSNSIGAGMGGANYTAYLDDPGHPSAVEASLPGLLVNKTKLDGRRNFNHIDYLSLNNQLLRRYEKQLLHTSLQHLVRNYAENAAIYFRPSSTYSSGNVIVERLPWRAPFEWAFSAPTLPLLLLGALVLWSTRVFRAHAFTRGLGLLLPGVFILGISIIADKGENMRFKFFLEPVMIVFMLSQFAVLVRLVHARLSSERPPG